MERGLGGPIPPSPKPKKEGSDTSGENDGISLTSLVSGVVHALQKAQHLGDAESAKLLENYRKEKSLLSFSIPAFKISDVDIELHFAIVGSTEEEKTREITDLKVNVSPTFLKGLEAQQISVIKLKITPTNLRIFEEPK